MEKELILYHGSEFIIKKPELGKGKPYNDYGRGFYCTESLPLAKEWATDITHDGYANKYILNTDGLTILNLSSKKYNVLHWLTILLKNRTFSLFSDVSRVGKQYLLEHYSIDTSNIDIIKGYRADDSYFAFAQSFLDNTISLSRLEEAMKLGNLGEQIVLISPKAFSQIKFLEAEKAKKEVYFPLRKKRNDEARLAFLKNKRGNTNTSDLYLIDLIRGANYDPSL